MLGHVARSADKVLLLVVTIGATVCCDYSERAGSRDKHATGL